MMVVALVLTAATVGAGKRPSADAWRFGPGVANHPVGVLPSAGIQIPAGWPLDPDGTLTCLTCHSALPAARAGNPRLRDFDGDVRDAGAFCARCHGAAGNDFTAAGMHWQAVARAHIQADAMGDSRYGGQFDLESRRCLECHDGVSASEGSAGRSRLDDPAWNHPVGVAYTGAGDDETLLRPLQRLPATVRLPGGKVSCVSCHNLYGGGPKLLSVTLQGSTLCFTCHQMAP